MASPAPDADPLGAVLTGTAAWYRRRFRLRNCRVSGGQAVHEVRLTAWIGGAQVPAPACHVGIGGWDLSALEPSIAAVTCRRCLRMHPDRPPGDPIGDAPAQLPLF